MASRDGFGIRGLWPNSEMGHVLCAEAGDLWVAEGGSLLLTGLNYGQIGTYIWCLISLSTGISLMYIACDDAALRRASQSHDITGNFHRSSAASQYLQVVNTFWFSSDIYKYACICEATYWRLTSLHCPYRALALCTDVNAKTTKPASINNEERKHEAFAFLFFSSMKFMPGAPICSMRKCSKKAL